LVEHFVATKIKEKQGMVTIINYYTKNEVGIDKKAVKQEMMVLQHSSVRKSYKL